MAESNNPETDVNELMERVRAEVAYRCSLLPRRPNGSGEAAAPAEIGQRTPPLPVTTPRQVDAKTDRLAYASEVIEHARRTTKVSERIPSPFRRLFRKQGRYNNLLLESATLLMETAVRLQKRLEELGGSFDAQNRWCADLGRHVNNLQAQADTAGLHLRSLHSKADGLRDEVVKLSDARQIALRVDERQTSEGAFLRSELHDARQIALRVDERQTSEGAFLRSELHLLHRRLLESRSARSGRKEAATGGTPPPVDEHELDALYVAFENQFRGSRELIKERLRIYLNDVKDTGLGNSGSPVLDLGCGRGEWLELVIENGFTAEGVDLNAIMVGECKQRGFPITEGDAIEYLRSLPAESRGVITAFHLIEHLEFRMLVELLHESLRVLRPGGLAIFETPNPDNVLVGSNRFYLDPTHRHPLPKEYTSFLLRSVGFADVFIRLLHPDNDALPENCSTPELRNFLSRLFFGDQDYAVIGRKPDAYFSVSLPDR